MAATRDEVVPLEENEPEFIHDELLTWGDN